MTDDGRHRRYDGLRAKLLALPVYSAADAGGALWVDAYAKAWVLLSDVQRALNGPAGGARKDALEKSEQSTSASSIAADGSRHTPGPWREGPTDGIGQRGKLIVVDTNGLKVADCEADRDGITFRRPLAEDTANARLIIAAPTFYTALLSIANSACCGSCQEAALVARRALGVVPVEDSAIDPIAAERPQEPLRAPRDSLKSTSLAAVPAQEEGWQPGVQAVKDFSRDASGIRYGTLGVPLALRRDPTAKDFADPRFEVIWELIKRVDVDYRNGTFSGATGNDVCAALDALDACRVPAAPHDARETTEGQKNQEDTRVAPSSTLPSQGSTAKNLNGR